MAAPQFIEETPLSLVEVKIILEKIGNRDEEMSYLSNKAKEYLDNFVILSPEQKTELSKKLVNLKLTRLKEEHICKFIDFLPKDLDELKVVLQSYPLSLSKKDQEAITGVVKEFV